MTEEKKWFVANDNGDVIGHDMSKAEAEALASRLQSEEPEANWEALNGTDEE